VTGDAGLMLAGFLTRGAICVNVYELSHHRPILKTYYHKPYGPNDYFFLVAWW